MHPFRGLALVSLGAFAGFAAAGALLRRLLPSRGDEESDEVALVAIFDGRQLASRARAFRGGSMLAWFGGIEADLREAELTPDAHLSVHALLGGIALKVPADTRIESTVRTLAGGVDVRGAEPSEPGGPTLRLEGVALVGGIAVAAAPADGDE